MTMRQCFVRGVRSVQLVATNLTEADVPRGSDGWTFPPARSDQWE